ncbi:membrane protease YdiL (CAAX protease family) [Sporosarcina luteola]|nr:membrane protease YdiL (CAAX protease family) [Sporosarcina luteola]
MKNPKIGLLHILIGAMFLIGLILLSYGIGTRIVLSLAAVLFVLVIVRKDVRYLSASILAFLISFYLYTLLRGKFHQRIDDLALTILIDRLLLGLLIGGLILTAGLFRKPSSLSFRKPEWDNLIYFPFITHGFHYIKIRLFFIISILGNLAVFVPLLFIFGDMERMKGLILFALLFSVVNAFMEELLWRGTLFQVLWNEGSLFYAILFTSLAFGIHHIAIGIPLAAALSFSIGGVFFAIVTVCSRSIVPAMLWHFIINLFMVFSNFIIP